MDSIIIVKVKIEILEHFYAIYSASFSTEVDFLETPIGARCQPIEQNQAESHEQRIGQAPNYLSALLSTCSQFEQILAFLPSNVLVLVRMRIAGGATK